mgnify:FL=1
MAQNIGKKRGKSAIQTRLEMERRAENKNPGSRKAFANTLGTTAELLSYGVPIGTAANLSAKAAAKLLTKYKNFKNTKKVYRGTTGKEKGARIETGRYYTPNRDTAIRYGSRGHLDFNPKFTGVVLSKRIPKKQVKIGQKVAERRHYAGKTAAMLPDELMLPKQYVGKTKVDIPATIQARFKSLKDTLSDMKDPKMYKFSREAEKKRTYTKDGRLVLTAYGKKMLKKDKKELGYYGAKAPYGAGKKKGGVVKKRAVSKRAVSKRAVSKRVKVTRGDGIAKRGKTRGRMV